MNHSDHTEDVKNCTECRDARRFSLRPKTEKEITQEARLHKTIDISFRKAGKRMADAILKEILAIDFDGVIHDYKNPVPGRRMGMPINMAKECIEHLSEKYCIIIHTVWPGETVEAWLTYYQIPFDEVTNIKPNAKFYIDDKAIRFNNWEETILEIRKHE